MYNHNKAQQSKNRVHISWDILYKTIEVEMKWVKCYFQEYEQSKCHVISLYFIGDFEYFIQQIL